MTGRQRRHPQPRGGHPGVPGSAGTPRAGWELTQPTGVPGRAAALAGHVLSACATHALRVVATCHLHGIRMFSTRALHPLCVAGACSLPTVCLPCGPCMTSACLLHAWHALSVLAARSLARSPHVCTLTARSPRVCTLTARSERAYCTLPPCLLLTLRTHCSLPARSRPSLHAHAALAARSPRAASHTVSHLRKAPTREVSGRWPVGDKRQRHLRGGSSSCGAASEVYSQV